MPVHKVGSQWQWGKHGKKYKNKADAEKQAAAAYAHGYKGDSVGHGQKIRGLVQELKFASMDSLEAADFGFQNEFRPASLDRDEVVKTMTDTAQSLMANRFNCPLTDIDLQKFERLVADWAQEINQVLPPPGPLAQGHKFPASSDRRR